MQTEIYLMFLLSIYNQFVEQNLNMSLYSSKNDILPCNLSCEMISDIVPSNQQWDQVNKMMERSISKNEDNIKHIFSTFCEEKSTDNSSTFNKPFNFQSKYRNSINNSYQKNICAYISKKVVQSLMDQKYNSLVIMLCKQFKTSIELVLSYYEKKNQQVFGIYHLVDMLTPLNLEDEEECRIKKVFSKFMFWFLRTKYIKYLLVFGKMSEKQKYVEFKNKYILYIDNQVTVNTRLR